MTGISRRCRGLLVATSLMGLVSVLAATPRALGEGLPTRASQRSAASQSSKAVERSLLLKCLFQSEGELRAIGAEWGRSRLKFAPGPFGDSLAGGAVAFKGAGAMLRPEGGTIEMWVRGDREPKDHVRLFFVSARVSVRPKSVMCMRSETTRDGVRFHVSECGAPLFAVPWADRKWHHLALVWEQKKRLTLSAWVDGKPSGPRKIRGKILELSGDVRLAAGGAGSVRVAGFHLYKAPLPAEVIKARAAGASRVGAVLSYGPDFMIDAEGFPELRGAKPIKHASAGDGKALLLAEQNARASIPLKFSAGTYLVLLRGFPPSIYKDACYVQIGSLRKQRHHFSKRRERVLLFTVPKAATYDLALLADPGEPGNIIDRVILIHQPSLSQSIELAEIPTGPVKRDFDTTFLATYDDGSPDADFSRVRGRANYDVRRIRIVPGKRGKAILFPSIGPYGKIAGNVKQTPVVNLLYRAFQNCPARRATIEFWAKSEPGKNIWADGKDHVFFNLDPTRPVSLEGGPLNKGFPVDLKKIGEGDSLVFECGGARRLSLPVADLDPSKWHHIAVSWDTMCKPQRMWLCVNGKGRALPWTQHVEPSQFIALHWGNVRPYWLNYPLGAAIDELKISNLPLSYRSKAGDALQKQLRIDEDLAMRAEDAVRRFFDRMLTLQFEGCWCYSYEWPSLLPGGGTVYRMPGEPFRVGMKYGAPTRVARLFLSAYEVLGDERYLTAAKRTGQFLIKAQQPGGYWTGGYSLTFAGPHPSGNRDYGRIQDDYQTTPLHFLLYLYRLTGDPAYLNAARRAADFLVAAQNPNGSWSGGFYWSKKQGHASGGRGVGGGEFNDGAMSDPFAALLLMYHVTKDEKYLKPLVKAADWVIHSKIRGPAWGWAQQYDANNRPVWARQHEPPAVCPRVLGYHAARILFWTYLLTGDPKYPLAMEDVINWMRKVEDPKRGWFFYYSVKDGKPCYGVLHREYRWHDDESKNVPKPVGFSYWSKHNIARIEASIRKVKAGTYKVKGASVAISDEKLLSLRRTASAAARSKLMRERCEEAIRKQTPEGLWAPVWKQPCLGHGLNATWSPYLNHLLKYLRNVRLTKGQIPRELITRGARNGHISGYGAWFAEDWFDTPLRKKRKTR